MLTLFEYLRRRAFEAVIDGTQDALEFLESQKNFDQSEAAKNALAHRSGNPSLQDSSRQTDEAHSAKGGAAADDQPLPPPRRRGRPRKNETKS